jgi:hypothetical protein
MGWTNSHLHQFTIEGQVYGVLVDEWIDEMPSLPDNGFTLDAVLGTEVKSFSYEYDFGVPSPNFLPTDSLAAAWPNHTITA